MEDEDVVKSEYPLSGWAAFLLVFTVIVLCSIGLSTIILAIF
jgi:hypothetical protein